MSTPAARGEGGRGLRRTAKSLVLILLRLSGVPLLVRHTVQRRRVTVVAYHDPSPEVLDRHLGVLTSLYSVIPLESFLQARRDGDPSTLPSRPLVVTLDDGWAGNHALLAVLERRHVTPTVFVCTQIVGTARHFWWTSVPDPAEQERVKSLDDDERLSWLRDRGFSPEAEHADRQALSLEEMREMAPRVDFQPHSRSHPILPRCQEDRAASEIEGSAADMRRLTGSAPRAFAYPNGDCSDRDVQIARRAGFECAFTIDAGSNDLTTDRFRLRRVYMDDQAGTSELIVCASTVYGTLMRGARRLFT